MSEDEYGRIEQAGANDSGTSYKLEIKDQVPHPQSGEGSMDDLMSKGSTLHPALPPSLPSLPSPPPYRYSRVP